MRKSSGSWHAQNERWPGVHRAKLVNPRGKFHHLGLQVGIQINTNSKSAWTRSWCEFKRWRSWSWKQSSHVRLASPQPQCHRSCWDTCLDHLPLGRPSLPAFACDTRPEPISATWKNSSQENEQMLCIAYFRKKMYRWQYLHSIPKTRPLNYDHVTAGGLHFPYCLNSFAKEWDRNPNPDHYIKTLLYEFSNMNILACNQNTKSSSWGCGAWLPAHWSPTSWSCPSEQPWHPHPHRQRIFACLPSW